MATTYTEATAALDEIRERSRNNSKRLQRVLAEATAAQTDLAAMQTAYSGLVSDINAEAAAAPGDQVWQFVKGEKDKLVADFQAVKTMADAYVTALENA